MLLVGLVFGRWWRVAIPLGGLAWAVLLIADGTGSGLRFAFGAAVLGAANTAAGALIHQGALRSFRAVRGRLGAPK